MSPTPEETEQLRPLLPLSALIEETLRTTPVHFGPHGHEDLVAQLTLRVAVWCGRNVLPGAQQPQAVLDEHAHQLAEQIRAASPEHYCCDSGYGDEACTYAAVADLIDPAQREAS